MPNKLIERLRGSLSTLLYFINTLFWFVPVLLLGLIKLLLPIKGATSLQHPPGRLRHPLDRFQQPDPGNHHGTPFRGGPEGQRAPE